MIAKNSLLGTIRRVWLGVFAALAIVFIFHLLLDSQSRLPALTIREPIWLAIGLAAHFIFWYLAIKFWAHVVEMITHTRIAGSESFRQLALVAVGKYLPGKIWGFIARGAALTKSNASSRDVLATAMLEQWTMLMSAFFVAGLATVIVHRDPLLLSLAAIGISASTVGHKLFNICSPLLLRLRNNHSSLGALTQPLKSEQYLLLLMMHSAMWCALGCVPAAIYFCFTGNGFSVEQLAAFILANTVAIVVGFAALFAPGGIGVRELFIALLLLPFVRAEDAAIVSIFFRFWTTIVDLLLGIVVLWYSRTQLAADQK